MIRELRALAVAAVACARHAPPAVPPTPPSAAIVVVISANAEWVAALAHMPHAHVASSPYGDWTSYRLGGTDAIVLHGGYGKVSAAGSTQYAIDRWHPHLIVNLGTCGAFDGGLAVGDVVLATRTIIYDIVEQMGDPDEAIADFATTLDTSRWPARLDARVHRDVMLSADRDLVASELPQLRSRFHGVAGDWESGAIAWVAARNHTPVIILRSVTDVVTEHGDATYGNALAWQRQTSTAMADLLALLADALPELGAR